MERYTKPVINWPLELTDGDCGYLVPRGAAHKADERVITYAWILDRALFGEVYWGVILPFLMDRISRIKQSSMAACRRWLDEAFHGYRTTANEWHNLQCHSNY